MERSPSLKSMTAYGRAEGSSTFGWATVEVTSLNRRYLEISCNLPSSLHHLEVQLRKEISKKAARGQINLSLFIISPGKQGVKLTPDFALIKELMRGWQEISEVTSLPLSLELLKTSGYPLFIEEKLSHKINVEELLAIVEKAFVELDLMKEREGKALALDLMGYVKRLQVLVSQIEAEAATAVQKYRAKLQEKMEALFSQVDERIYKEIALLAEKLDISEEITRCKSHLAQFSGLLEEPLREEKESKGKTLDFITQELMREVNTMGAKGCVSAVIEAKSLLEKIREQVQNVE